MKAKRIVSGILCLAMTLSQTVGAYAETYSQEMQDEKQLEQTLRGSDEFVKAHPNGEFEFIASKMNASENLSSVEVEILRKGGTQGEVELDFKALDVTTRYGEDYRIKVGDSFFSETLEADPDARPMVDSFLEVSDIKETDGSEEEVIAVIDDAASDSAVTVQSVIGENPFKDESENTADQNNASDNENSDNENNDEEASTTEETTSIQTLSEESGEVVSENSEKKQHEEKKRKSQKCRKCIQRRKL
jgi:hypothetical protein